MIRVGVVGAGGTALRHVAAWERVASARVVGVAGSVPAAGAAAYPGLAWFATDAELCAATHPDLLAVTADAGLAAGGLRERLEAGAALLVPPPAAHSLRELETLRRAAKHGANRLLTVAVWRFASGLARAKEMADSGILGEPLRAALERTGDPWGRVMADPATDADPDAIASLSARFADLDLLAWLLGTPLEVTADPAARAATLAARVTFADGASADLRAGPQPGPDTPVGVRLTLTGPLAALEYEARWQFAGDLGSALHESVRLRRARNVLAPPIPATDPLATAYGYAARGLLRQEEWSYVPLTEVRTALAAATALHRARQSGEPQPVPTGR